MNRQLVFLLPRIDKNVFSAHALLARQDLYASFLAKEQGGNYKKALALYSGTDAPVNAETFNFIQPIWLGSTKLNLFSFLTKSLTHLKNPKGERLVLVAGTPFQPLLVARLIASRIDNCAIQVSIHGELASIKKSQIKYLFLKSQLRKVSCLRFVSSMQKNDFQGDPKFSTIPSVVTPVPINTENTLDNSRKRVNLGFVGRIHQERDPLLWTEIANSLPDVPKLVVGDGPLLNEMQRKLKGGEFTGVVDSARLDEVWPRIKVLLSTAPHESYGLTIREALLNGVPVVAKKSAGARELSSKFPNLVKLFTTPTEATAHLVALQESPPHRDDFKSFREWFVQEQNESLRALAKLWAQA